MKAYQKPPFRKRWMFLAGVVTLIALPAIILVHRMERNIFVVETSAAMNQLPCVGAKIEPNDISKSRLIHARKVAYGGGTENHVFLPLAQIIAKTYFDATRSDTEINRMLAAPYRYELPSGQVGDYLGFEEAAKQAFGKGFCSLTQGEKKLIVHLSMTGTQLADGESIRGAAVLQRRGLEPGFPDDEWRYRGRHERRVSAR